ncbi:MAG: hypothetical protein EXS18_01545 [Verrucomicrobiae bacterium]|nr:hypothetical protein [Verrucomicrobiae bacterium]
MSKWKEDLSKVSGKSEKEREAAFEAAMMAELARAKPSQAPQPAQAQSSQPPVSGTITITVTEGGKTTTYPDLASVPVLLRQKIVNAWLENRSS